MRYTDLGPKPETEEHDGQRRERPDGAQDLRTLILVTPRRRVYLHDGNEQYFVLGSNVGRTAVLRLGIA